ncbi:MAG: hypothetical protein U0694_27115 [Anaerolineae bacterium]
MSRKRRFLLLIVTLIVSGCGSIRPRVTETPDPGTPGFFSQQVPTSTPPVIAITPTAVIIPPATVTVETTPASTPETSAGQGGGLVNDIIQGFILPIWNFLLSLTVGTVQTLWSATGNAGGVAAQASCCGLPAILLSLWATRLYTTRRHRK